MTSILIASVLTFIFGAVWFTVLFGKMWASLVFEKVPDEKMKDMGMIKPMILNFIINAISAGVVYYLFPQLFALSFGEFLKIILIVWLGFSFPIYANQAIWEKKSWKLVVLNSVYGILFFSILSGVIYFWN